MAALAFLAEAPLVHVVVRMAIDARRRRPVEGQGRVTLRAADDPMQSEQREIGQVMLEHDVGAPSLLSMAGFAAALEFAGMRVFAAVAARAGFGQLLRGSRCGVAGGGA